MNTNLPKEMPHLTKKLSKKTVIFIVGGISASLLASLYILFFTGPSPRRLDRLFKKTEKAPTVTLETDVKNPFDKETQFVNPFDPVKSPFYAWKKQQAEK